MVRKFGNYSLIREIHTSPSSTVWLAEKEEVSRDGTPESWVVKVPNQRTFSKSVRSKWEHEFRITQTLNHPSIIRTSELLEINKEVGLVQKYGGESLSTVLRQEKLDRIPLFFSVAIQTTEALAYLHDRGLIHKDINPRNIVINPSSDRVSLIDFGIASETPREQPTFNSLDRLEGSPLTISPEQTGRMNRDVDYRSDFYSLGATLFEVLVGRPPFPGKDLLELVHAHLAFQVPNPSELNPSIPKMLSQIVLKLLEKNAERRYQSEHALLKDLRNCRNHWQASKSIPEFQIASRDTSKRFEVSQTLFGRETELAALLSAYQQSTRGEKTFVTIAGPSGIGKTQLVQELHRPITETKGLFLSGKFDQLKRGTPYLAIQEIINKAIEHLLNLPEAEFQSAKKTLQKNTVGMESYLIEIAKDFSKLLPVEARPHRLEVNEKSSILKYAIEKVIETLAEVTGGLVLFLDDMQWADLASLEVIERIAANLAIQRIAVLLSYRDNETDSTHPFMASLKIIQKNQAILPLTITPLSQASVGSIVSATIHQPVQDCHDLAETIFIKTNGNPFFVNELLKSLYAKALIFYDENTGNWRYDGKKIQELDVQKNVVDFILPKFLEMSPAQQELINLCSFLGSRFELNLVCSALGRPPYEVHELLRTFISLGAIRCESERYRELSPDTQTGELTVHYRFQHDRIQQAAYQLIGEDSRILQHRKIAELLLKAKPADYVTAAIDEREKDEFFTIIDHLSRSKAKWEESKRKPWTLGLIQAAHLALASAAPDIALTYFKLTENDLDLVGYTSDEKFTYHEATLRCLYENHLTEEVIKQRQVIEKIPVEQFRIFEFQMKLMKTLLQYGLYKEFRALVDQLCVKLQLPREFPPRNILYNLRTFKQLKTVRWSGGSIEPSQREKLIEKFFLHWSDAAGIAYTEPAHAVSIYLYVCKALNQKRLTVLRYDEIYFGLIALAFANLNLFAEGTREVIESLQHHFADPSFFENATLDFVQWEWSFCPPLIKVSHAEASDRSAHFQMLAQKKGHQLYSSYHLLGKFAHGFFAGKSVSFLVDTVRQVKSIVEKTKDPHIMNEGGSLGRFLYRLATFEDIPCGGVSMELDQKAYIDHIFKLDDPYGLSQVFFYGTLEDILEERYSPENQNRVWSTIIPKAIPYLMFAFYLPHAAIWCHQYLKYPKIKKPLLHRVFFRLMKKQVLQHATLFGRNYLHWLYLLQGSLALAEGKVLDAINSYNQALQNTLHENIPNFTAFFHELLFNVYRDHVPSGTLYLKHHLTEAIEYWEIWGADKRATLLRTRYPELLVDPRPHDLPSSSAGLATSRSFETTSPGHTSAQGSSDRSLDFYALSKAAQEISKEVTIQGSIQKLLTQLLESSSASYGAVLCKDPDRNLWETRGRAEVDATGKILCNSQAIAAHLDPRHPKDLVVLLERNPKSRILDKALESPEFQSDPYIKNNQVKSVLIEPISFQGELKAIIYLENKNVIASFTKSREELVRILSTQAAISLENATLYQHLEEKVKLRTEQLSEKTLNLMTIFKNIKQGIVTFDEQLKIQKDYSSHLHEILGEPVLTDRSISEVLFNRLTLTGDQVSQITSALNASLSESDSSSWEVNKHLLPREVRLKSAKQEVEKILELDWDLMQSDAGLGNKVMLVIRDVTELTKLKSAAQEQRLDLEMIGQLLQKGPEKAEQFLRLSRAQVEESAILLRSNLAGQSLSSAQLNTLFRNMHTLKGNARANGFLSLSSATHELEKEFERMKGLIPNEGFEKTVLLFKMKTVEDHLKKYSKLSEMLFRNERRTWLKQILTQGKRGSAQANFEEREKIERFDQILSHYLEENQTTLSQISAELSDSLGSLAAQLGKPTPKIETHGDRLSLHEDFSPILTDCLMHMMRNAIDHGIERPEQRRDKKKPDAGQISILASKTPSGDALIRVFDDGAGLNLKLLRQKASTQGTKGESGDQEVAESIFRPGISTAERVSEISGFGVGMDAVKGFLEKAGCQIQVIFSKKDEGNDFRAFEFQIQIPKKWLFQAETGAENAPIPDLKKAA